MWSAGIPAAVRGGVQGAGSYRRTRLRERWGLAGRRRAGLRKAYSLQLSSLYQGLSRTGADSLADGAGEAWSVVQGRMGRYKVAGVTVLSDPS